MSSPLFFTLTSSVIDLRSMSMRYSTQVVLRNITTRFNAGELTAISGPNGAGKSTLLAIISGLKPDFEGECLLWETPVQEWSPPRFCP